MKGKILFDVNDIGRMTTRIAHEIIERNTLDNIVLIGIKTRGIYLAQRLQAKIQSIVGYTVPVESLDIAFYRDDLEQKQLDPIAKVPHFSVSPAQKTAIIVDDVLYTGRTVRAAIDAIMDVARPAAIRLVILVDRGHRELPLRADYIGKNIPTHKQEQVKVRLEEVDNCDEIVLI